MPSSSRSKSHKKRTNSSREYYYSDVDEDLKMKERNASNGGKGNGVSVKVSKESLVSGRKRKLGNDLSCVHGDVNLPEEYATPTKRRKEKSNGGEEKIAVSNLDEKKMKSKSKSVSESKSGSQSNNERRVGGVRNIELEKDLGKRMKRRGENYKNKDRYHDDVKEDNERSLSSKSSHVKDIKHKDERHEDKYRESRHKEDKSKNVNYKKEREKDNKHKDDKKYKECGDKVVRHRDNKGRNRDNDKDEGGDYRTCKVKDQNCESKERSLSDDKVDQILVNHDHHRSSPNDKYYPTSVHHRVSKQEETKSRDYNGNSNKDFTSENGQFGKINQKDDNNLSQQDNDDLSVSSPYMKNNHFSRNHKSFIPPQTPFRNQTNYKNTPNWPYPLPNNNYISYPPFFNPFIHQFVPPIFHQSPIYHEQIPPFLNNWGPNKSIFGNGPVRSHGYENNVRVDLENSKSQSNNQVWEDTGVTVDMRSPVKKDEILLEETVKNVPEVLKAKKENDGFDFRVYLSKIDISEDLTESDLYDECIHMLDLDLVSDEFDYKILFLEEDIEADVTNGDSLFAAINNSVFKKAMSLYTKQKEKNQKKVGDSGVKDSGGDVDAGIKDSGGCLLIEFKSLNSSRIH